MEPLKNMLGPIAASEIAEAIHGVDSRFSVEKFMKNISEDLAPLELKARMKFLTYRLAEQLNPGPRSFPTLVGALRKTDQSASGLYGFRVWPLTEFVAEFGLENLEASMAALKEMTKVFTAEFAVRPFFLRNEEQMLLHFKEWANDNNEHVRRLVSEGSRPLLPWGQKLPRFLDDPELTWPLIAALKQDASRYVQKSVANHLNDQSKKNSQWLIGKLKTWPNHWVKKQALRTLIKKGDKGALRLMGVVEVPLAVGPVKLKRKKIQLGETLELSCALQNNSAKKAEIIVDLKVYFLKANNNFSGKVFKGTRFVLAAHEKKLVVIRRPIKKVTTRRYYPGYQGVTLVINGQETKRIKFILRKSSSSNHIPI